MKLGAPPPVEREIAKEDAWDRYVEKFIKDYQLDDAQSETAWSILRECKRRARDHRTAKRDRYAEVQRALEDANRGSQPADVRAAKMRVWRQIEKSLNKPIMDLYVELQNRLDKIPTDAQRARVEGKSSVARRNAAASRSRNAKARDAAQAKEESGKQEEKPAATAEPAPKDNPPEKADPKKKVESTPSPKPDPPSPE
jgi:hypothetical protein